MSDSGIEVVSPLFDWSLLRPIIIMLRILDNGLGKLFSNFVSRQWNQLCAQSAGKSRGRQWVNVKNEDLGLWGTWTLVRLGCIEDLSNAQQVICQLTHTNTHNKSFYKCFFLFLFSHKFTTCLNLQLHQHSNSAISVEFSFILSRFFNSCFFAAFV